MKKAYKNLLTMFSFPGSESDFHPWGPDGDVQIHNPLRFKDKFWKGFVFF